MDIVVTSIYSKSKITGHRNHWYNDTHAECTRCKQVFPHTNFTKVTKGNRPVAPMCKPCNSDVEFAKRRKDTVLTKYKHYKSIMRREGNDCDLTLEEFRNIWPKDDKCPILGHTMKEYPIEERGKWTGGRHYPYTPTIDHVDPRMPMNKENMQIICWRANELKGDSIPEELELLYRNLELRDDRYWKGSFMDIISSSETTRLKQKLSDNNWVGKYSDDRKL